MKKTPQLARTLLLSLALVAALVGCAEEPGGPVAPYPAPDFSLPDFNPRSASWNADRSPSDELGKVLVLYFVSFG